MKTLAIDICLYRSDRPGQKEVTVRIPASEDVCGRLVSAQDGCGVAAYDQTALCNLAAAIGNLNGMHGFPLRVREEVT